MLERNKLKINTEQNFPKIFVVCVLNLTNKDLVNRVINIIELYKMIEINQSSVINFLIIYKPRK